MDFPAWRPEARSADPAILAALGRAPVESFVARERTVAVHERPEDVAVLRPDFAVMRSVREASAIATAPGCDGADFVSRYFAPNHGIDEDPLSLARRIAYLHPIGQDGSTGSGSMHGKYRRVAASSSALGAAPPRHPFKPRCAVS
jgi:predicted PhzF superfamily epimerase YddE/YHI9